MDTDSIKFVFLHVEEEEEKKLTKKLTARETVLPALISHFQH